jgi:hypothetical protein
MPTIDLAPHRLADIKAADEALAALRRAAARARGNDGPVARVFGAFVGAGGGVEFANYQSTAAVADPEFLALVPAWVKDLREIAATHPRTGACTIATALQLWLWTMNHFRSTEQFPIVLPELTGVFGPLLAARSRIVEIEALAAGDHGEALASDLSHAYAAHAASAAGALCAELVFGYRRHLTWDAEGCATCYRAEELDELEGFMPGIGSSARAYGEVIEADGRHAAKAGPCATADGVEKFMRLRARLDGCLTGARRAKERAAAALAR